jgi:hypothetical protein
MLIYRILRPEITGFTERRRDKAGLTRCVSSGMSTSAGQPFPLPIEPASPWAFTLTMLYAVAPAAATQS